MDRILQEGFVEWIFIAWPNAGFVPPSNGGDSP
jgi:hypothetical protein